MTIRELLEKKRFKARLLACGLGVLFVTARVFPGVLGSRLSLTPGESAALVAGLFACFLGAVFGTGLVIACPRCKTRLGQSLAGGSKTNVCPGCGVSLDAPARE